jgi:hypothetical protein
MEFFSLYIGKYLGAIFREGDLMLVDKGKI